MEVRLLQLLPCVLVGCLLLAYFWLPQANTTESVWHQPGPHADKPLTEVVIDLNLTTQDRISTTANPNDRQSISPRKSRNDQTTSTNPPPTNPALKQTPTWTKLKAALKKYPLSLDSSDKAEKKGCTLPRLDPWNPELEEYFQDPKRPYEPDSSENNLLYTAEDKLHLNTTALEHKDLTWKEVECVFSYISSKLPPVMMTTTLVTLSPNFTAITAFCSAAGSEVFSKLLFYVPRPEPFQASTKTSTKKYSVLLFIIDGVSQMNAFRSLPLTLATASSLGSVVFRGHHKVGLNSVPNVMGLLTGSSNLTDQPWLPSYTSLAWQPMVTNLFHDSGWTTLLLHDQLWMGLSLVFNRAPDPFDISYNAGYRLWKTWGRRHSDPTDLVRDFTLMYRDRPTFAHVHLTEYTHDDLNGAKSYDRDLALKLRIMERSGALDDTFLVLMGDHGYRFGGFSKTSQGNVENNMPLLLVVPPKSLEKEEPELVRNLRLNSLLLTSHWDLHQTLRHLLALAVGQDRVDSFYAGSLSPGSSLLSPLRPRTCTEAGISLWFCSCPEDQRVIEPGVARQLLEAVLEDMNAFLQPLELGCQELEIAPAGGQTEAVTNANMKFEGDLVVMEAFVETKARSAHFQVKVLLRRDGGEDEVRAAITRLDRYSLTSACVPEGEDWLRPHCVCQEDT